MNLIKRAWLFARDYIDEFGCAWSIARMRDCERAGGHRWVDDQPGSPLWLKDHHNRVCTRCGCGESIPTVYTTGTTASNANVTVRWS